MFIKNLECLKVGEMVLVGKLESKSLSEGQISDFDLRCSFMLSCCFSTDS